MSDSAPATPEHLLQHADWLRRLARSVALDPQQADDLVQEAWLAALQNPPAPDRARSWFRAVVRNALRQDWRRDTARRAREADTAREEAVAGVEERLVRAGRYQDLLQATMALDPAYRDVVLMRFFDGLPPRRIASDLGLPVETVKTRLKRAIARLRIALDWRYGDRSAWAVAWLPFLLTPTELQRLAKGAASLVEGRLGEVVVVSRVASLTTALGAAVATLLVAAGAGWWLGGDDAPVTTPLPTEVAWVPIVASTQQAVADASSTLRRERALSSLLASENPTGTEAAEAADVASSGWTGRVQSIDGQPLEGVEVAVLEDFERVVLRTSSAADGSYNLRWDAGVDWHHGRHSLVALAPEGWIGQHHLRGPGLGEDAQRVDFLLSPGTQLRVQALDRVDEQPLEGVRLGITAATRGEFLGGTGWYATGVTDADGMVELCVPREQQVSLAAGIDGRVRAHVEDFLCEPASPVRRVRLQRPCALMRVEAVDALTGAPVTGARFTPLGRPDAAAIPAAPGGVTTLERDRPRGPFAVRVEAPGHLATILLVNDPTDGTVPVRMWRPGTVEVAVERSGQPVQEAGSLTWTYRPSLQHDGLALASCSPFDGTLRDRVAFDRSLSSRQPLETGGRGRVPILTLAEQDQVTDPQGSFSPALVTDVAVSLEGAPAVEFNWPWYPEAPATTRVLDLAPPTALLEVRVADGQGSPAAGVGLQVFAQPGVGDPRLWPRELSDHGVDAQLRSGPDGTARVRVPAPAEVRVFCGLADGRVVQHLTSRDAGRTVPVDVVQRGDELALGGRVVDREGWPVPAHRLGLGYLLLQGEREVLHLVELHDDGSFLERGFLSGTYRIQTPGFGGLELVAGRTDHRVQAPELFVLTLDLRDASGAPLDWEGQARLVLSNGAESHSVSFGPHHRQRVTTRVEPPREVVLELPGRDPVRLQVTWEAGATEQELRVEISGS